MAIANNPTSWIAGGDPATVLASRYGCPPSGAPVPDGEAEAVLEAARRAPSNLSGLCDVALQPAIDAALR
ncbi:hypothetical protein K4H02_26800, partial [Mycobacterium tuberculosis]|nr:hypothetical protein [Mycobacterium tuberculosis]